MDKNTENARTLIVGQPGLAAYTSIGAAAADAREGDTILVHGGVYREQVVLPVGNITLQAAPGQTPVITGSEPLPAGAWSLQEETGLHTAQLEKEFFGTDAEGEYFNPFAVRWMSKAFDRPDFFTCGCVYLGERVLEQVFSPEQAAQTPYSWYAEVTPEGLTLLWANFAGEDLQSAVEVNVRMQGITAKWNLGHITVRGFKVMRACGPKTIDFWMSRAKPMCGAIATNGGHHWTIEHCEVLQCRGVAVDFGSGSAWQENRHGGEPELYGHHLIRENYIHENGTNGIMAYRGAYTTICRNRLVNNNTLNTGLLSEAYIKNVSGGWGIRILDNYFYSDQDWTSYPVWLDSECDMCRVSGNVFWCKGEGRGFTALDYECNAGWNLIDNNIFVGVGISLNTSSASWFVHNLWLDMHPNYRSWPTQNNTRMMGTEGFDGYTRCMRLVRPGTLETIGRDKTSRWQTFNNEGGMLGNLFLGRGLTTAPTDASMGAQVYGGTEPAKEAAEPLNAVYGEMVLNTAAGPDDAPLADPDYSGGSWRALVPGASDADKALARYMGVFAWVPADEETQALHAAQMQADHAKAPYGWQCDYNLYAAGARPLDDPAYGAAHGYVAEQHSRAVSVAYTVQASREAFSLTLTVDEEAAAMQLPLVRGCELGASPCYVQAVRKYPGPQPESAYLPDDVTGDFFGDARGAATAAGPFARLAPGSHTYCCWPKSEHKE